MFEGDLVDGELEIGQVASMLKDILPAKEIVDNIIQEFYKTIKNMDRSFMEKQG